MDVPLGHLTLEEASKWFSKMKADRKTSWHIQIQKIVGAVPEYAIVKLKPPKLLVLFQKRKHHTRLRWLRLSLLLWRHKHTALLTGTMHISRRR